VPYTEKLLFKLIDMRVSTNAALGHVTGRRFTDPVRHAILLPLREREGGRESEGERAREKERKKKEVRIENFVCGLFNK